MARKGDIEIPIAVDTGGVEKSIHNGLIDPIEDAEKALKKLGDTDAGRDIDKAMDKAQDATEDLETELERARKELGKLGYAAKDAGTDGAQGLGKIKDGAQEVQREIGANLGETVATFRGELSDLGQIGQDTLGGLAATLASTGPAGIVGAVGLAGAAVGWGIVAGNIAEQTEAAEKLRDRLSAAYQDAAEAGEDYLGVSHLIKDGLDVQFNPDRAKEYERLLQTQKETGLDMSLILKANAGDLESITTVQGRINGLIDEQIAKNIENADRADYSRELQDVENHWRMTGDAADLANGKAQDASKYTSDILKQAARDAANVTEEVDGLGNRLLTLDTGEQIVIDVATGQAHQNLDKFKGDADDVIDTLNGRDIVFKASLDVSAIRNYKPPTLHIPGKVVSPSMGRQLLG